MAWNRRAAGKYGNEKTVAPCAYGFSHRSKLEAAVCQVIHLREKAGEIAHVAHEVHVRICGPEGHECDHKRKIESVVDFEVRDVKTGGRVFIESKGFASPVWPIKLRLWRHYRTERLEIWGGSWQRPRLQEVIEAK